MTKRLDHQIEDLRGKSALLVLSRLCGKSGEDLIVELGLM
jgi:hypothetical protein